MHVFNFDNILPTAIQKVCFINWNLYKHMRMPVYSCPSQHWLLLIFFIFLNLIGKKWHLVDVLIYVSLIAREAQHFLKRCFYLLFFREGKGGRRRGREISMCGCLLSIPRQEPGHNRNRPSDSLVHRLALSPLSHTSQGSRFF